MDIHWQINCLSTGVMDNLSYCKARENSQQNREIRFILIRQNGTIAAQIRRRGSRTRDKRLRLARERPCHASVHRRLRGRWTSG